MRALLLLVNLSLLVSCRQEQEKLQQPQSFRYRGEFYPAFMPECRIDIQAEKGVGQIKLTVTKNRESATASSSDSLPIHTPDLALFYTSLDSVRLLEIGTHELSVPGSDGITVYNTVIQDGKQNEFHFWSPETNTPEHRVAEAVLGLARRKFTSKRQQEYFKNLEQYFE